MLIKGSSYIINQEVLPKSLQPAVLTLISDIRDRELLGLLEGYHVNKATHFIHLCVCGGLCFYPSLSERERDLVSPPTGLVHTLLLPLDCFLCCLTGIQNSHSSPHPKLNQFMPITTYFTLLNSSRRHKILWFGHKKMNHAQSVKSPSVWGGWGVCRKTNTHLGPRVFVSLLFYVYSAVFGA